MLFQSPSSYFLIWIEGLVYEKNLKTTPYKKLFPKNQKRFVTNLYNIMDQVDITTNFSTDTDETFDFNKWYLHVWYLYSQ